MKIPRSKSSRVAWGGRIEGTQRTEGKKNRTENTLKGRRKLYNTCARDVIVTSKMWHGQRKKIDFLDFFPTLFRKQQQQRTIKLPYKSVDKMDKGERACMCEPLFWFCYIE